MLINRRSELYYTASGIITPIGGRPVHRLREDCARDGHDDASMITANTTVPLPHWTYYFAHLQDYMALLSVLFNDLLNS